MNLILLFDYCKYLIFKSLGNVCLNCLFVFPPLGLKKKHPKGESSIPLLKTKNGNFCSFLIQRICLQHAWLYQFWMTFSWTGLSLRPCCGAVFSLFHVSSLWFFFFPLNVVWLCLTFVNILACVVLKGDISWKGTKIMGSLFFFF